MSVTVTSKMKQPSAYVSQGFKSAVMHKHALEQKFGRRIAGVMLKGIYFLILLRHMLQQPCSDQLREL